MNIKKSFIMTVLAFQLCQIIGAGEKAHSIIAPSSGRPLIYNFPAGGITTLNGGTGDNNEMRVGSAGTGIQSQDVFHTKKYRELEWYEEWQDHAAKKTIRIRKCHVVLDNDIVENSNIYVLPFCNVRVYEGKSGMVRDVDPIITDARKKAEEEIKAGIKTEADAKKDITDAAINAGLLYVNEELAGMKTFKEKTKQPELTPEQKALEKQLEDAGWKRGQLGQLVPPSIGQAIQKAVKK